MQHVEVIRRVDAAPERTFDLYTDHVSWTRWAGLGTVTLAREGTPPPNGVGCVRVISNAGFRVHEEVLSFDRPRRMTYQVVRGAVPMRNHFGEVAFEPEGEGTRITWRCRFDSKIPGLGRVQRWFITRMFRRALAGLARELG